MDTIAQYQAAVAEIKAASAAAEQMEKTVSAGAKTLGEWRRAMVTNATGGYPLEVLAADRSIDSRGWPSGQQIADVLQRYHKAKSMLQSAYAAVPESQRDVVRPPATYI